MDIFRRFRKCFYCKGKENLSLAECGYYNEHRYYHPECLHRVLANPEAHESYVDMAISISDELRNQDTHREWKLSRAREALGRLEPSNQNINSIIIMGQNE